VRRLARWAGAAALLALAGAGAMAQGFDDDERADPKNNIPYDGRFVFARIKFHREPSGWNQGRPDIKWDHDYPRAEINFTRILQELTTLRPFTEGSNIFTLDDPDLHKYPVAYMAEPGFWTMNDAEALGLRNYLLKGGFIIFDDFVGPAWMHFEAQMRRVLPQALLVPLDASHPIFDAFYRIEALDFLSPYRTRPLFYGIYEDNDPSRRLMAIINYNNDISEYWEFSGTGYYPVELSNEAYKLGINYVIYGMTR
jgi:hypothetical protein